MEVTFNNFDEFLQYHVRLRKQIEEQQEKIYELEREVRKKDRALEYYQKEFNKRKSHSDQ